MLLTNPDEGQLMLIFKVVEKLCMKSIISNYKGTSITREVIRSNSLNWSNDLESISLQSVGRILKAISKWFIKDSQI